MPCCHHTVAMSLSPVWSNAHGADALPQLGIQTPPNSPDSGVGDIWLPPREWIPVWSPLILHVWSGRLSLLGRDERSQPPLPLYWQGRDVQFSGLEENHCQKGFSAFGVSSLSSFRAQHWTKQTPQGLNSVHNPKAPGWSLSPFLRRIKWSVPRLSWQSM